MSKTRWFFLWLLFIAYLFLGASIFYSIERDLEEKRRHEHLREKLEIQGLLDEHLLLQASVIKNVSERERSIDAVFGKLALYCGKPVLRSGTNATEAEPYVWTYYNSFFFALTTLSTIGYGNLSPTSEHGKIWVIIYSLIGIPFNGIVLTHLGDFFGSKFLRAHHRYKNHTYESRVTLIIDILIYLVPGMGVFILAPSVIFFYYENWTLIESIYYSFVSLTTIGYGDFVAGQTPSSSTYEIVYKIFLLIWIMFGLGYLVMILGFISRAMRSDKINMLEKKVAQTLKHTQSKIWNEFVHDVHYLRRVLNEMYLLKVKPVYKEKEFTMPLSQSCPNLTEWPVLRPKSELDTDKSIKKEPTKRRRAFSENEQEPRLQRVLSDGALAGIDRQATFSAALLDSAGFLIPSAFGPGSPEDSDSEDYKEGGINVFSDEEILASEEYTSSKHSADSSWFIGGAPLRRQGRAMSDAQYIMDSLGQQKTWAGAESLHQFALLKSMRAKSNEWPKDEEKGIKNMEGPPKGLRRLSIAAMNFFSPVNKLKKKAEFSISRDPEGGSRAIGDILFGKSHAKHRLSLQEEDNTINEELNYYTQYPGRRPSILDLLAGTQGGDTLSPVLEQTSIADFIRVVHSLKAYEASRPSSPTPLSPLFSGPILQGKDPPRVRGKSTSSMGAPNPPRHNQDRRFSHIPNLPQMRDIPGSRPRAASIAPMYGGMSPVDRRLRKVSGTTRSSPHSSGVATPTRFPPPSLVVTSPDGLHKFSVHNVEQRKTDNFKDINNKQ